MSEELTKGADREQHNLEINEASTKSDSLLEKVYRFGSAHVEITPPKELKPRLGGYLRIHKYSEKAIHPLMARAFCLKHPSIHEKSILIISCDLVGFQYRLTRLIRRKLMEHTGIPIKNIMIHFTHTHSSPDTIGIFPNRLRHAPRTDVQYPVIKYIMRRIYRAGREAVANATLPVSIGFGESEKVDPPLAVLRRPPYTPLTLPLRVMKITEYSTNQLIAVLVNYQGHPTQMPQINTNMDTEYPGVIAEKLMKRYPDLKYAAYFNGGIGDVSIYNYRGYFQYLYRKALENIKKKEQATRSSTEKNETRKNSEDKGAQKKPQKNKKNMKKWREIRKEMKRIEKKYRKEAIEFAIQKVEELADQFLKYIIPTVDKIETYPLIEIETTRKFLFPVIRRIKPLGPRLKYWKGIKGKLWILLRELKNQIRVLSLYKLYEVLNFRKFPMLNIRKNGHQTLHQTELQIFKFHTLTDKEGEEEKVIYWIAIPGEPFLVYQENALNQLPERRGFFTNMANDTCGYIFPWEYHVKGGYEETFSFDALYGIYLDRTLKELLSHDASKNKPHSYNSISKKIHSQT